MQTYMMFLVDAKNNGGWNTYVEAFDEKAKPDGKTIFLGIAQAVDISDKTQELMQILDDQITKHREKQDYGQKTVGKIVPLFPSKKEE